MELMPVGLLSKGHVLLEGVPRRPRRWRWRPSLGWSAGHFRASSSPRICFRSHAGAPCPSAVGLPTPVPGDATVNPIEHEGVYPLPEAQRDRVSFKINVGYPSPEEEREIIYRIGYPAAGQADPEHGRPAAAAGDSGQQLRPPRAGRLCRSSRLRQPAKPRAVGDERREELSRLAYPRVLLLGIITPHGPLALVRGRDYVIPQDVIEVIPDVLRHRLVLICDALADEISPETAHQP